jgi:hypothetical protein
MLETQSRRRQMSGAEELISIGHGPAQPQDALNKPLARGQGGPQLSALTTRKISKRIVGHGGVILSHAAINESSCGRIRTRLFNKRDEAFRITRAQCCKHTPRDSAPLF